MDRLPVQSRALLLLGISPIFIALFIYSVTYSFIWDEGFHLVAASLIANGKKPYIDFCFPQTPLNAYINAGTLLVFGNKWRPIHLIAAGYLCVAIWLVADFVQTRLPCQRWRTPCALVASVLFGLNLIVVQFGPAAQAYAIGMLMGAAAFRAALPGVSSAKPWLAFLAGVCACGAAASTLLTAPLPLVLLCWFLFCNEEGPRFLKVGIYLLGCAVPFAPVFRLYWLAPRQTLFNVLQYQASLRRTNWGDANMHDVDALTDWLNSPQALLLLALFAAAMLFLFRNRQSVPTKTWKEFMLAAVLSVALMLFISTAHPTFERYFVVAMPFIGSVAALGFYAAASRLASERRAWLTCGLMIALGYCMFFRDLFDEKEDAHWSGYEQVAQAVAEVTPLSSKLYADELIYFLLQRDPPEGMEFSYSQKLELPPDQEKLLHIVSSKELKQRLEAGEFKTLETCREEVMDDMTPGDNFKQHTKPTDDCNLFWEPKKTSAAKR